VPPAPDGLLGQKPSYLEAATAGVPNEAAIARRIWTPGLDDGWVPQGLTVAGSDVLVAQYHPSPDLKANTGPCRVVRLDRSSGRATGTFDLPVGACTHAGGLAYLGGNRLLLADTRRLFLVDISRAFSTGHAEGAMKSLKLEGALRGSFAGFDGRDPWIGTWTKKAPESRMYRFDAQLFDQRDGRAIDDTMVAEVRPIPLESQGLAFDGQKRAWLSASNSKWGKLYRVASDGRVEADYDMTVGLEDLEFDDTGALWGVSESGTRKYMGWAAHFPFVFAIDLARLVPSARR
jgi:hypothetical protein